MSDERERIAKSARLQQIERRVKDNASLLNAVRRDAAVKGRVIDIPSDAVPEEIWLGLAVKYAQMEELNLLYAAIEERVSMLRDEISRKAAHCVQLATGKSDEEVSKMLGGAALGVDFNMRTIEYHTPESFADIVGEEDE